MMSNAQGPVYSRPQIMGMTRHGLMVFFKQEGLPDGMDMEALEKFDDLMLKHVILFRLEVEGRIRE